MLWNPRLGINDTPCDVITELLLQNIENHSKCKAAIMAYEIFDILQKKGAGPMMFKDAFNIEK